MKLKPYQKRYIKEYKQLKAKYVKLHKLLVKYNKVNSKIKLSCPLSILNEQEYHMERYLDTLRKRALYDNIVLK